MRLHARLNPRQRLIDCFLAEADCEIDVRLFALVGVGCNLEIKISVC